MPEILSSANAICNQILNVNIQAERKPSQFKKLLMLLTSSLFKVVFGNKMHYLVNIGEGLRVAFRRTKKSSMNAQKHKIKSEMRYCEREHTLMRRCQLSRCYEKAFRLESVPC
ncbi:hypothetical protein J437_LFUL009475 [Ladona fulva]|uniref:Uncharacterized protein n=1 Tax=Ladona fulva TaxID=123851 RepID=A0A8K0JZF8_LADFU|nr:hypothetical protein J437_LFUL009475 [Ladona fulva]